MTDIRVTGRMVNFTRLTLGTNDHDAIREQLTQMLQDTSSHGALVIVDSHVEQNLVDLLQLLRGLDLQPMAVIEGVLAEQARQLNFPVLAADRPLQRIKATQELSLTPPVKTDSATPEDQPQLAENADATASEEQKKLDLHHAHGVTHVTSYHDEILRTGQCIVQDHGDIILNAGINNGSEVIASGNIHIYGSVRGRVIAGAGGNQKARIFCHVLEAELVSIAGIYCVAEDIPPEYLKKPVHIYLNDNQELVFEALAF